MSSWLLFLPACFALNMAPGPNNMLAFANGARAGFVVGFAGGLGRMPAFAILIVITAVGLGALLAQSALAFTLVKLLGAAYLVYIGWRLWTADGGSQPGSALDARAAMRRDFTIAISNPKAIAIFTAFFPQFLDPTQAIAPQFLQMGVVFLLLEVVAVAIYAVSGAVLGGAFRTQRMTRLLNRGSGAFLIGSGVSLAFSRH